MLEKKEGNQVRSCCTGQKFISMFARIVLIFYTVTILINVVFHFTCCRHFPAQSC